ncbi:MAG: ATP-binding cassette domain-containing protein [Propionibacteriaceae bacterium]|nr:ATP-binding cassette domain-containing protein [Propionibacteriaceae bacterium]
MAGAKRGYLVPEPAALARLECQEVSFAYGRKLVLDGFSFTLSQGITGLLGPNGAGKSTLLNVLATIRQPRTGTVRYDGVLGAGKDLGTVRKQLGYLPQRFDLMAGSSCLDNVTYAAWCNGVAAAQCTAAADAALELVNLGAKRKARVRTLSGGQRQRLGIACAIAHSPAFILLDEPTVGLDPAQRIDVRQHLVEIAKTACVLVSTHLVEDLAAMGADAVVIHQGHKVFQGSLADMTGVADPDVRTLEASYLALVGGSSE